MTSRATAANRDGWRGEAIDSRGRAGIVKAFRSSASLFEEPLMSGQDSRTCVECEGAMSPIIIMDKAPGVARYRYGAPLEYRLPRSSLNRRSTGPLTPSNRWSSSSVSSTRCGSVIWT